MSFTNFSTKNSHSFGGTEVKITQEGIPDAIPVEMCYVGWQQSLHLLSHVVEPNIPDGN